MIRKTAALVLFGLVVGCGVKKPPAPPSALLPPAPSGLEARVRENCADLRWEAPEPLPAGYRLVRSTLEDPETKFQQDLSGAETAYTDCQVPEGHTALYQVESVNAQGKASPPSAALKVRFAPAPLPPQGLRASPGDGFAELCWQPSPSGPEAAGYRIYRAAAAGSFGVRPRNAEPAPGPCWVDGNLTNHQAYRYQLRGVALTPEGIEVEGPASEEIAVTPEDQIAPLPPVDLVAAPAARGAVLHWSRSREPDLAGYHVYRRPAGKTGWARITAQPVAATEYLDADPGLVPGREYVYAVAAVDRADPPNESKKSAEAKSAVAPR